MSKRETKTSFQFEFEFESMGIFGLIKKLFSGDETKNSIIESEELTRSKAIDKGVDMLLASEVDVKSN